VYEGTEAEGAVEEFAVASPKLGRGGLVGATLVAVVGVTLGIGGLDGIALFGASTVLLISASPKLLHNSSASSFLLVQKS
jgi:hypothetical protein